ncbi:MAG TPA: alpha-amylase [Chitinophagaceae bacterium]
MTDKFTFIQFFHWYYPGGGVLWNDFANETRKLSRLGITHAWLPPPYKGGTGKASVGYDVYDLFDLGEFEQQGSVASKYGTKRDFINAVKKAHKNKIGVIADAVLNHKAHGDELEKIEVRKVNPENRTEFISEPMEIEAWTKFFFPGRNKKYSEFIWDYHCFTGVDWAEDRKERAIFKVLNEYGEQWEKLAEEEFGNYDYLSFSDIEYRNQHVREELKYWGKWFLETTAVDGFRLDAVKHINPDFINEWIDYMNSHSTQKLFYFGEYWNDQNVGSLKKYIDVSQGRMQLIDAPLHLNFYRLSTEGRDYEINQIFDNTLIKIHPELSITFVSNHDSQPLQLLEKPIAEWCNPLAYAIILLREQGIPCIFYPDLYGAEYTDKGKDGNDHHIILKKVNELPTMLLVRKFLAHGAQLDYFDHKTTVGWTRKGIDEEPGSGCAVILSGGDDGWKYMELGTNHAGKVFVDCLGKIEKAIKLDKNGGAEFTCKGGSVSVWVSRTANRTKLQRVAAGSRESSAYGTQSMVHGR